MPQWIGWASFPGKASDPGRTAVDSRRFVNGVLWVLRSGARWSDLPPRYGPYKSVHKRLTRWAAKEIWEQVFKEFTRDRSNERDDSRCLVALIRSYGAEAVIPPRSCQPPRPC